MSHWSTIRSTALSPWILGPAAATAASSLLVAWLVLRPDCMVVETVTFEGRAHAGWSELRHLSDLRNGTTIWSVDLDAMERGVEPVSYTHLRAHET